MRKDKIIKNIPNFLTFTNMLLGLTAVIILLRHQDREITVAAVLILAGGVIDFSDGFMARKLNAVSDMGKQLDSFADIITFGIAPVCLVHNTASETSLVLQFALGAYLVAGAFRLARYNLGNYTSHFAGLPITVAGILTAVYCITHSLWAPKVDGLVCTIITTVLVLTLAGLMVSKFKVKRL